MKRSIGISQWIGFGVTAAGGTLLHFLYDWLGKAEWIAPFSGINESTWEHMKLLFWPMVIFAVIQSFFFKDNKNYWCIKLKSILLGLTLIPILFYSYNGIIGVSPDWINISIFFIADAIAFIYEYKQFKIFANNNTCISKKLSIILIIILAIMFILFTFVTPKINLFKDPITGGHGIIK